MSKEVCLITGVGPGTGAELARIFSQKYDVAMVARDGDRLNELSKEIPGAKGYSCDVTDTEKLKETVETITEEMGAPTVLIHNAVGGVFADVLSVDPKHLDLNFRINTVALLNLIQAVGPAMIEAGKGVIMATGNTSAYRGVADYAGFAPTKAAQRILLESAARKLGPEGVHVSYVAVDAIIDVWWAREMFPNKPNDFFCQPKDIAAECYHIAHQPKSTWTFDTVIRPHGEKW